MQQDASSDTVRNVQTGNEECLMAGDVRSAVQSRSVTHGGAATSRNRDALRLNLHAPMMIQDRFELKMVKIRLREGLAKP